MRDQCDRIALLPADIVMINKETIQKLMAVEAEAVIPLCNNEKGHPIVLSRMAVTEILRYDRGGGVRAAIQAIGVECTYIETQDWGILDDTYKDNRYLSMIEEHSRQLLRPVISVTIQREEAVINETLIMILDLTNSCESIKQASTWMRMSYSLSLIHI